MAGITFRENGVAGFYYCLSVKNQVIFNFLIAIQASRHLRTIFPSVRSFVHADDNLPAYFLQYNWCLILPLVSSTATTTHIN